MASRLGLLHRAWTNPPAGTNSFAVVMEEIETGSKLHCGIYNISLLYRGLYESCDADDWIACVLGHETGHVTGRHAAERPPRRRE